MFLPRFPSVNIRMPKNTASWNIMSAGSNFTLNRLLYRTNFIIKNLHLGKLFSFFWLVYGYACHLILRDQGLSHALLSSFVSDSYAVLSISAGGNIGRDAVLHSQSEPPVLLLAWRVWTYQNATSIVHTFTAVHHAVKWITNHMLIAHLPVISLLFYRETGALQN
jgi:hypothetical protein